MATYNGIAARIRGALGPVIGVSLMAYFLFHGIEGERGILAYWQLKERVETVRALRDDMATRRARLSAQVALLRTDGVDPDLLDERARAMLGRAHPDELVIPTVPPGEPGADSLASMWPAMPSRGDSSR